MSSRDRLPLDSAPTSGPFGGVASSGAVSYPVLSGVSATMWEQWYQMASSVQREQLLEQARQQGLLFAHQLPSCEPNAALTPCQARLSEFCRNEFQLQPILHSPIAIRDSALDATQRQAVSLALSTSDLSLIRGATGTGKSRVAGEILFQAQARGWRTLFIAPSLPALERAIEFLGELPPFSVLLLHGHKGFFSSCLSHLAFAQQMKSLQEQTLSTARKTLQEAICERNRLKSRSSQLAQLESLLSDWEQLTSRQRQLAQRRDQSETQIVAEVDASESWRAAERQFEVQTHLLRSRLDQLKLERDQLLTERQQLDAERLQLMPLVEAKQEQRWWTGAFWRATLGGNPQPRLLELAQRYQKLCEHLDALSLEHQQLGEQLAKISEQRQTLREQLLLESRQRHEAELTHLEAELQSHRQSLHTAWRDRCSELGWTVTAPPCRATLERLLSENRSENEHAESLVRQRTSWVSHLETAVRELPTQLLREARILVCPLASLPKEVIPGERCPEFDLILVEEADRLSEADLLTLARRSTRLVLLGEKPPTLPLPVPQRRVHRPRPTPPTPPPFQRFWDRLHPGFGRIHGQCLTVDGRIRIRCQPLADEQLAWLQHEPVFDRPDITVGIVAVPGETPWVAEILFPETTSIAEAKRYIYSELEMVVFPVDSFSPCWSASDSTIYYRFTCCDEPSTTIELEPGLREQLCEVLHAGERLWRTIGLEFDRASGWDESRAACWLEEKIQLTDHGRTVELLKNYRSHPSLSQFFNRLLYSGSNETPQALSAEAPVRFYPVLAMTSTDYRSPLEYDSRRAGEGPTALPPRMRTAPSTGAKLEFDLTDSTKATVIPPPVRAVLPTRGLVNYVEALAVVKALEELTEDADFLSLAHDWSRQTPACCSANNLCGTTRHGRTAAVQVLSVYPAQVELIRALIQRSTRLSHASFEITVDSPRQLAHSECLVAVLSLTRSQESLAVPFCDHPSELLTALTRPKARLLIFGDVGTISRRCQWFGALDHLDETTGPMEQALLAELLVHLPEQDLARTTGRTLESSSV